MPRFWEGARGQCRWQRVRASMGQEGVLGWGVGILSKVTLDKMTGMADGKARALARAHKAEATAQVSSLSSLFLCMSCFAFSFFLPLGPRARATVCTHALHRKQQR